MGVVPESVMELDSMESTKHMVEAGLGIAILPVIAVERDVQRGTLARVEILDMEQPAQREIGVHVMRNRAMPAPLREFLRLLTDTYDVENVFEARRTAEAPA